MIEIGMMKNINKLQQIANKKRTKNNWKKREI